MAVTPERLAELLEIYNAMKVRIEAIDQKYRLDYVDPEIIIHDSLYLEKMKYEPKTEDELNSLAEQYVAAAVLSKQRSLDSTYSTKVKCISRKRSAASKDLADKLKRIDQDYAKALADVERKLTNNGLLFSTTATAYREQAYDNYNQQKTDCNLNYDADIQALDDEERDVDEVYQQSCSQLNEEKQALITKQYQALLTSENKAKLAVEKYNNNVDEKEQRYQVTRAKFIESMRRAERDRVLDMTKLYLQLGDVTYRDRMVREKYAVAQDAFWPLRRDEANVLVDYDTFLMYHLEKYYSTFVDWVNTALLPPNN